MDCTEYDGSLSLFAGIVVVVLLGAVFLPGVDVGLLAAFGLDAIGDLGLSSVIRAGFATAIAAFGPFLVDESGEAGEEAAIPLAETGAEGGLASILEQRFATSPQDVTIPGSKLPNFSIDVNATDFVNQLIADGFSMYNDAATQIYTNGLETYFLYFRNSGVWGGLYNGIAGRFKFVLSGP